MEQSNKKNKNAGVRGVSWREKEILDLLDIWGEAKVQAALRASHRNLENFQKIADEMAARGHGRTAEECRTKTKTMRLEYRRVIAHNNQSRNSPITCPYYAELHNILRGDGSVKPQRLVRSLKCKSSVPRLVAPAPVQPSWEELFSHDLPTINSADIRESHLTVADAGPTIKEEEEDPDEVQIDYYPEEAQGDGSAGEEETSNEGGAPSQESLHDVEPTVKEEEEDLDEIQIDDYPGEPQGDGSAGEEETSNEGGAPSQESLHGSIEGPESTVPPSPATRLATTRVKKARVTGAYTIAERMMEHSTQLLERELQERRRDQVMELLEQRRYHEEWRKDREDRARFMREFLDQRASINDSLQRNFAVLQSAVDTIKAILSQPCTHGDGPSATHSCTGHSAQHTPTQLTTGNARRTVTQGDDQDRLARRKVHRKSPFSP